MILVFLTSLSVWPCVCVLVRKFHIHCLKHLIGVFGVDTNNASKNEVTILLMLYNSYSVTKRPVYRILSIPIGVKLVKNAYKFLFLIVFHNLKFDAYNIEIISIVLRYLILIIFQDVTF